MKGNYSKNRISRSKERLGKKISNYSWLMGEKQKFFVFHSAFACSNLPYLHVIFLAFLLIFLLFFFPSVLATGVINSIYYYCVILERNSQIQKEAFFILFKLFKSWHKFGLVDVFDSMHNVDVL